MLAVILLILRHPPKILMRERPPIQRLLPVRLGNRIMVLLPRVPILVRELVAQMNKLAITVRVDWAEHHLPTSGCSGGHIVDKGSEGLHF